MEEKKYILEGVLQTFSKSTRNRPYYTEEEFQKQLQILQQKIDSKESSDTFIGKTE